MTRLLGISAFYHDSAAALVIDGRLVAAVQEERFSRKKHDARFPRSAIQYCLSEHRIGLQELDAVVFYDKPLVKFERLLETYLANAPRGFSSFLRAMPIWLKEKLFLKSLLRRELAALDPVDTRGDTAGSVPTLLFTEHHQAHAASAFYPSPFEQAAVLCMDGVGEWATTSVWRGEGARLDPLWEIRFPHSLGLLYSAFTYFTGFRVNSGEYKLMGLAPYGEPSYADKIRDHLIDIKPDGTFRLNMKYFDYATGLRMTNHRFHALFGGPPREPESALTQREMDLARSIQVVTEEVVLRLAKTVHAETGLGNLCLAGGVALNCVANGRILRESPFESLWVQPASGDAGGAVGAALCAWYERGASTRVPEHPDSMQGAYLGPAFDDDAIGAVLQRHDAPYTEVDDETLFPTIAGLLANGAVVGWFQGQMEFGPRALGNRSILADPRDPEMQTKMNLKIKQRESFRPFAPAVLAEDLERYFQLDCPSPYMLLVADVARSIRVRGSPKTPALGLQRLKQRRSDLPAITHVDFSARVQTVHRETNPRFHRLIHAFSEVSGVGVLINTSFNVRGEPIVCTPSDAYRCFMRTEMDYLVMNNFLLAKQDQPSLDNSRATTEQFELD